MLKFSVLYYDGRERRYEYNLTYDQLGSLVLELMAYNGEILDLQCYWEFDDDEKMED